MNIMRTVILAVVLGLISTIGLSADPTEYTTRYLLKEEVVVPGHVDTVLTGERLVRLKTDYGATIEVPEDNIEIFAGNEAGYQKLEPGLFVQARMNPGLLGVAPAERGQIWVLVDGKQVVKLYPKDLNDDLFLDNENEAEIDGRTVDVKLAELIGEKSLQLELK